MMRKAIRQFVLFPFFFLGAFGAGVEAFAAGSAGAERLTVFVSVPPQKTFVEKIGGTHVRVQAMVLPGYSPHTYDPTPKQIAELTEAVLYVRTGVPFENAWMERIRSANQEMQVLDTRAGIDLQEPDLSDHKETHTGQVPESGPEDAEHEAGESDPHVWTSPRLVKQMAARIRDKLTEIDPRNAQDYGRNYDAFAAELDALDRDIRSWLQGVTERRFMVYHPAWGYFAKEYGLIQVPIENEGKGPGPRALAALIEQAKREQIKIIFVQPQFSAKSAEQVARAIGGRVVAIDPLSPDYSDNLRRVAQEIAGALRK